MQCKAKQRNAPWSGDWWTEGGSLRCDTIHSKCNAMQHNATQHYAMRLQSNAMQRGWQYDQTQCNATQRDFNAMKLQCEANAMPMCCQRNGTLATMRHIATAMQSYAVPQVESIFGGSATRNRYLEGPQQQSVCGGAGVMVH